MIQLIGDVVEAVAIEKGISVEIAARAHPRPRDVKSEGYNAEQQVDDPDSEILPTRTSKLEGLHRYFRYELLFHAH